MENLGAITFRETALLVDESTATHAERERVADVVAHENAHMWFGDLVTMSWWNGLWLNEAFATFMEMLAVDAWKPEWRRWTTFGASRSSALSVDGLRSTRPIEFPVEAPKDADAMFDVLTYEKGASVLRMLEQYIGPERLPRRRPPLPRPPRLRQHRDDRPVARPRRGVGAADPRGHGRLDLPPRLSADRRAEDGREPRGAATAAFPLSGRETPPPSPRSTGKGKAAEEPVWRTPVQLRFLEGGGDRPEQTLLSGGEAADVRHGPCRARCWSTRAATASTASATHRNCWPPLLRSLDRLEAIERFNLVNDAWAAVLAGLTPLTEYLDLTSHFRGERDKNVWSVIVGSFHTLNRIIDATDRPRLAALVRDRLTPAASELGWRPQPGESELTSPAARRPAPRPRHARRRRERPGPCGGSCSPRHSAGRERVRGGRPILAHAGDAARYAEFEPPLPHGADAAGGAALPAGAGRVPPAGADREDAGPHAGRRRADAGRQFVLRALLLSVDGRERAWAFIEENWERINASAAAQRRPARVRGGGRPGGAGVGAAGAGVLRGEEGEPRRQDAGAASWNSCISSSACASGRRRRCGRIWRVSRDAPNGCALGCKRSAGASRLTEPPYAIGAAVAPRPRSIPRPAATGSPGTAPGRPAA